MQRLVVVLAALVLVSGLAGCSRIFGQRYDNFTSYYNTFYNAKREFNREQEQLLKTEAPVDRDRYLSLFYEPREGGEQREGFEKAIEKGVDLIADHPTSKWVDDAVLVIGKARYYKANWSGAEEKFREAIEVGTPKIVDEAWFWLGRTLLSAERYEDAALVLREALDRPDVRDEWAAQMRLALAETDVRGGEWETAVVSLREGIEGVRDRELAARAEFLLGQVYETLEQPAEAAAAYRRALAYKPRYELAYAAGLSEALALSQAGEGDRAIDLLRRMERDDKNFESRAEIEMTRAQALAAAGKPGSARDLLRDLLYDPDPTMQTSTVRGPIHYRLAEVYRDGFEDFVRAAAHYDTAATAIRQVSLAEEQTTPQAIADAAVLSDAFGAYASVAVQVAEMDSLLYLGSLDDVAFEEAIERIRVQRQREAAELEAALARRRAEQRFAGGPGLEDFGGGRSKDGITDDAGVGAPSSSGAGAAGGSAGFLDFRNPARVQEARLAFESRWGDRPYLPNWRRAEALTAIAVQEGVAEDLEGVPQINTDDFTRDQFVDISPIPRDPFTQQEMRASRAAARYELGNTLFLSLGRPDSAIVLYQSVLDEGQESAVAQRAYFALAEAQRALGNEAEAERLYNDVIERYPDSRFAEQSRVQLGLAPIEQDVTADSLGLAEAAYGSAYSAWKDGDHEQALDQMLTLSSQYATTPVAARARLAAGAIYTEWAAGDEDALLAPVPALASSLDEALLLLPPPDTIRTVSDGDLADSTQVFDEPLLGDSLEDVLPDEEPRLEEDVDDGLADLSGERSERSEDELSTDSTEVLFPSDADLFEESFEEVADLVPDSTINAADSTLIAGDTTNVVAETAPDRLEPEEDPWLDVLYASIESDFPGTPYAERARTLRTALDAMWRPELAPLDSALADSAGVVEAQVGGAVDDEELYGRAAIAHRKNMYSWVVFESADRSEVEEVLGAVFAQGYRSAINTVIDPTRREDNVSYQVLVGSFRGEEAAEAARGFLPGSVPTPTGEADPETFRVYALGPGRGQTEQASALFGDSDFD